MASASSIEAARAFVRLFADDSKLVSGLRAAEAKVKKFGQNIKQIGQKMLLLGTAAKAPFGLSIKTFASFDDQMRAIKGVTGATGKEFEELTEKAKLLGRTTSFTTAQVAAGMLELGRAGFDPKEIDAAIPSVLNLARATGTELAQAAEYAGNTLRSFELPASEMNRVCDVMVATANNSAQTLDNLGESMSYCAPIASEYGLSLEQTAKALGSLANFGIKGSQAGTSLRRILSNLADPAIQKRLQSLGVSVVDIKTGKLRDVSTVLRDLGAATQGMAKDKKLGVFKEIFGLYAIAGGAKLTTAEFDKLIESVDNAGGIAKNTAEEMDKGIGGAFRKIWSATEVLRIEVGEALAPSFQAFIDKLTTVCNGITDYLKENKELVVWASKIVTYFLIAGGAVFAFGYGMQIVGSVIGGVMMAIKVAAATLAFFCSWTGIAIVAIGGLVGACYLACRNFDTISKAFAKIVSGVKATMLQIGNTFSTAAKPAQSAWSGVANYFSTTFNIIGSFISSFCNYAIEAFNSVCTSISWIGGKFGELYSVVADTFSAIFEAVSRGDITAAVNLLWASLKLIWVKGTDILLSTWYWLIDTLQTTWTACVYKLGEILIKGWYGVQEFWAESVYTLSTIWVEFSNGVINAWKTAEEFVERGIGFLIAKAKGVSFEELDKSIAASYEKEKKERETKKNKNLAEIQNTRDAKMTSLETEKTGVINTLKEDFRRNAANRSKVSVGEEEYAKARAAYDEAISAARNPKTVEDEKKKSATNKIKDQIENFAKGLQLNPIGERLSVAASSGTFSGTVARGLGSGSITSRIAQGVEKTAKFAERTAKNTDPNKQPKTQTGDEDDAAPSKRNKDFGKKLAADLSRAINNAAPRFV